MDLEPGWEKKALIILGIIFVIIAVYAFNPFHSNSNVDVQNESIDTAIATPTVPVVVNNSTANNTTVNNTTTNSTFQISADVAKNIAAGANPGYTAGQPTQGNVTINNSLKSVWIVPLTQGSTSKKIYVDLSTGTIVGSV
ncbi:peptidase [Methanobacterium sp.]|uniref:peptidase n=1 Tax=Methanobacterium sp. TaxID=2164 RepID=UPI003C72533B